jgi:hypothetical protein
MSLGDMTLTDIKTVQEATFPGMAHFAGSGPAGESCGGCLNWDLKSRPQKGRCHAYRRLTGRPGPAVPPLASACKYFEAVSASPAASSGAGPRSSRPGARPASSP